MLWQAGLQPAIELAGHGDEPVEAQAFIAAGRGVTVAHHLNVLISPEQVSVSQLADEAPARRIQAAIMRDNRSPTARVVIEALREVGNRRGRQFARTTTGATPQPGIRD